VGQVGDSRQARSCVHIDLGVHVELPLRRARCQARRLGRDERDDVARVLSNERGVRLGLLPHRNAYGEIVESVAVGVLPSSSVSKSALERCHMLRTEAIDEFEL
jgi:hypothetical protein